MNFKNVKKIINKLIENDDSTDDDLREGLDIEKILEDLIVHIF